MKYPNVLRVIPGILIFSTAVTIRLIYNIIVARGYYPLHDSLTYQSIAYNLLNEHCYCLLPHLQTVDRAPLWPAIIAAIYGAFSPHDHFVRLFLCIVGSATCLLIYFFAKDLFGPRLGFFAGLVGTGYPFLYIYDGWLYSESLYTFLLLAFCYILYRMQRQPSTKLQMLSGVLLGLLALTRPNGLILLGLFIIWAVVLGRAGVLEWRIVTRGVMIVSLVALIIVGPWTIRNYLVTHTFVPIAVGDGKVLLGAYNNMILQIPYFLGIWIIPHTSSPAVDRQFANDCAGACEVKRDNTYKTEALLWIESHQDKLPYLLELHLVNTWQTTTQEADLPINRFAERPSSQLVDTFMKYMTPIVLEAAAFGAVLVWKRWRELLFMYLLILFTIIQNTIFYGIPRFRAPIEPMLILLGTGAIWWTVTMLKKCRQATQPEDKETVSLPPPSDTERGKSSPYARVY